MVPLLSGIYYFSRRHLTVLLFLLMTQSRGKIEGEDDNQDLDASTGHVAVVNNSEVAPMVTLAQFVLDEQKRTEKLLPIEEHWRDRYELLLDHGYQLRSRLRPGWCPRGETLNCIPASLKMDTSIG